MNNPLDLLKRRQRIIAMYRDVFESPKGQEVLAHLAKHNFVFKPTFVSGDPHMTSLHEGQRRVVLSILTMLNTDMEKLGQLQQET